MNASRLLSLSIEDFGLIEHARVEFSSGFTVFSGETGSGKTMLLGALGFALGERASGDAVRSGAARASATLEIDADAGVRAALEEAGFAIDDDELLLVSREMSAQGKSSARINGRPAAAAVVRDVAARIVDFIGQHEQQRLLSAAYQGDVLDRFAGDGATALRSSLEGLHATVTGLSADLAALQSFDRRAAEEIEDARFALAEIDEVAPLPGEDTALRERRELLASAERIAEALAAARDALAEREGSAIDRAGEAVAALARVSRLSSRLQALHESAAAAESALSDVSVELARAREATEFDASELEAIAERLDRIERLKRRHGGTIEAVLAERAALAAAVDRYETRDEQAAAVRNRLAAAQAELERTATELSAARCAAAAELEDRMEAELRALSMPAARFSVALTALETIGSRGAERIEFALSPNAGEAVRQLAKAASGGELSRVLLALAVVLADRREHTALVFDEIDAGIGGAAAAAVGERIGALARGDQVVCVTHLAQIASWADLHYTLRKNERAGETVIEVVALGAQADVEAEIARMLSGSAAKVALDHAGTLLRDARKRKGRLRISA